MSRNRNETSALVDGLLKAALYGGFVAAAFMAPNSVQALEKPANNALDKLDERAKKRKLQQTIRYMKSRGLVSGDYDHGIEITEKGRKRLKKKAIHELCIDTPVRWDGKWRIVFFDIPEKQRAARVALINTLRDLGFQLLQRSIWIHPYPSKAVLARVCDVYMVREWVTYIETDHIDHEEVLRKRFSSVFKHEVTR